MGVLRSFPEAVVFAGESGVINGEDKKKTLSQSAPRTAEFTRRGLCERVLD